MSVGYPERIVDRQLSRAKGDWPRRVRTIRLAQNMMVAAIAVNLVGVVGLNLLIGIHDRRLSMALGVTWLGVAYVALRQRRHLNSRKAKGA